MQSVLAQAGKTQHRLREAPRIFWKLGRALFWDSHSGYPWCNKCILPSDWCPYHQVEPITCDICKPDLWHTTLDNNKDDSDYEWEASHPNHDEGLQDLPEDLHTMDEGQQNPAPAEAEEVGGRPERDVGVSGGMDPINTSPKAGDTQQLLCDPRECEQQRDKEQLPTTTDTPQEAEHHHAKGRKNCAEPVEERRLPEREHGLRQGDESPHHRLSPRPRNLLPDFNKCASRSSNGGVTPPASPSHLKRRRTPSASLERIRSTKNTAIASDSDTSEASTTRGRPAKSVKRSELRELGRITSINPTQRKRTTDEEKEAGPSTVDVPQRPAG